MEFYTAVYEKIGDVVSDPIPQLIFQKLPFVQFWGHSRDIHNYLKRLLKESYFFQPQICMKLDFIHLLQPKQHFDTD